MIGSDITIAFERRRSAFSDLRVALIDEYNREVLKGQTANPERLSALARRIREHEDLWDGFARSNPKSGLDAMARAHTSLVTYARSPKKVSDLASLVEAMEAFAARAAIVGQAVQQLRNL